MELGNFSVSLPVKNLQNAMSFYATLGFEQVSGDINEKWVVMQNEEARIGLFQDILKESLLTFNPKWNKHKEAMEDMVDVRGIAEKLVENGYSLEEGASLDGQGPGYFFVKDPDGNMLLFDQHI